jgi:hypothetical protein
MKKSLQGGYLCGRVRFTLNGPPLRANHCHCRMCQLAAGAPFVTWAVVRQSDLTWPLDEPKLFPSSDVAERGFCPGCGSALTFRYLTEKNEIDLAAVCFDDPRAIEPIDHIWTKTRPDWIKLADGLPEHEGKRGGNSTER